MEGLVKKLEKFLPVTLVAVVLAVAGLVIFVLLAPSELFGQVITFVILTSPIWIPLGLLPFFIGSWMEYVQTKAFLETETTVLEIRLPREVTQSPLAMEDVLNVFFQTGEPSNLREKYLQGKTRPQTSLEIASFEGDVRFFVRVRKKLRNIVEAQFYSQYPSIEIDEVPDYMNRFEFDPNKHNLFGIEQQLKKPDPYPIKTYVDFGLDKEQKEEFKIDPLNGILEFMGSLGKGEYGFYQIIFRAVDPEDEWRDQAKEENQKIIDELKEERGEMVFYRGPTTEEKELMDAIARNTAKKPFHTGIRIMYMADLDHYNSDLHAGLPTLFRQFESHNLNGFKPKFRTVFPKKLEDPWGKRKLARKRELFKAYRRRSYLTPPHERPWTFVLSSEEIATLWHLPGRAAATPTLGRIQSRRGEAPPNLPT